MRIPVAGYLLPVPADRIRDITADVESMHGPGLTTSIEGHCLVFWTPGESCRCVACDAATRRALARYVLPLPPNRPFIVCPECGNKRCPRAAHHDNRCTGSNEPGQEGSAYL